MFYFFKNFFGGYDFEFSMWERGDFWRCFGYRDRCGLGENYEGVRVVENRLWIVFGEECGLRRVGDFIDFGRLF